MYSFVYSINDSIALYNLRLCHISYVYVIYYAFITTRKIGYDNEAISKVTSRDVGRLQFVRYRKSSNAYFRQGIQYESRIGTPQQNLN